MREDWVEVSLSQLANDPKKDIVDGPFGSNLKANEYVDQGIPVLKIQNIKANRFIDKNIKYVTREKAAFLERHSFKSGDLIITKLGDPLGLCCEVPSKYPYGIIVADLLRFRPDDRVIDKKYLKHCINSSVIQGQLRKITKGTTRPRVNLTIVRGLPFHLPPLPEQRAIVAKIEALFAQLDQGLADLRKAQVQLSVYRQAVLKKAFEGDLTKEWRQQRALSGVEVPTAEELLKQIKEERQKHYERQLDDWKKAIEKWEESGKVGRKPGRPKMPTNLDDKIESLNVPVKNMELPEEWNTVPLAFTSDNQPDSIVDGPFGSSINVKNDYKPSGVPVIRMVNIRPLKFVSANLKYIVRSKFNELKRHNVLQDDLLIAKVGATIGDCCLYPKNQPEGMLSTTGSCRLRVDQRVYSVSFIANYMYYQKFRLRTMASQTAQPFLNMKTLRSYPIPICSLEEQHQIVKEIEARLSVCEQVEKDLALAIERSRNLRQSILKKAFEGKLLNEAEVAACKTAPDYKPAQELLDEIRQLKTEN